MTTHHSNSHSPAQLTQQFFNWHTTFIVLSSGPSAPTSPLPDTIKTCRKTISSKNYEMCSQTTICIRQQHSDASAQMRPLLYYYTSTTINKNYTKRHEGGHNNSSTTHKLWRKWTLMYCCITAGVWWSVQPKVLEILFHSLWSCRKF
jgi:hypothetical protein